MRVFFEVLSQEAIATKDSLIRRKLFQEIKFNIKVQWCLHKIQLETQDRRMERSLVQ